MFSPNIIYVRVYENLIEWDNVSSGETGTLRGNYSSKNLRLGNFDVAEKLVSKYFTPKGIKNFLKIAPTLIMHQPSNDHELSQLELRALRELGYAAGARTVYVWNSFNLSHADIANEVYKNT